MSLIKINELLEKYPDTLTELGWSKEQIKTFYEDNMLKGYYEEEKKQLFILEEGFLKLVEFFKSVRKSKDEFEKSQDFDKAKG